jgi:hypothetical protein
MSVNLCRYETQNIGYNDLEKLGDNVYYEIKYNGTHICLKYENELKINTRKDIPHEKSYQNLFYQVAGIEQVINYIKKNNQYIIHGELVHKKTSGMQIHTNETPIFIIYDIFDKENNKYLEPFKVHPKIFLWYPLIYFNIRYILNKVLKERLEGILIKTYNNNNENCKEGQNFNLCVYKYKPYFEKIKTIIYKNNKNIDSLQFAFLLGEIDNDLKYEKNNWYNNHPELYKFLISNKDKIDQILQNENFISQIEKETHLDINKIKEYIKNFKR